MMVMPVRLPDLLNSSICHLKADWVARLRGRPAKTVLSHADILVHRMDSTILELRERLRRPAAPLPVHRQTERSQNLAGKCPCGLNPLLDFYVTGAEALQEVLPELSDLQQIELNLAWHALAQSEIEILCSACCRAPEECPLRGTARNQPAEVCTRRR